MFSVRDIKERMIQNWEEYYINLEIMFKILAPARELFQKAELNLSLSHDPLNSASASDTPLLQSTLEDKKNKDKLLEVKNQFNDQLILELKKVEHFYKETLQTIINPKFRELKAQLEHAQQIKCFDLYQDTFELAFKELYKDLAYMERYLKLNKKIKEKLILRYNKFFNKKKSNNMFDIDEEDINKIEETKVQKTKLGAFFKRAKESEKENIEENKDKNDENDNEEEAYDCGDVENNIEHFIEYESVLNKAGKDVPQMMDQLANLFEKFYSYKYKFKTYIVLQELAVEKTEREFNTFSSGLFVGFLIFQFLVIVTICFSYNIDMDFDEDFKSVFPMFRGFFIICIYWWVHGINVCLWSLAKLNYRRIFQIDDQNSSIGDIFMRAAMFSLILFCSVLIYLIKRIWPNSFFGIFKYIPLNVLPLICWGSLIFYLFTPLPIWNYDGRTFLADLFKDSMGSLISSVECKHAFFMIQICSFISTLRDAEYTFCYYAYYNSPLIAKKHFCSPTRTTSHVVSIFPIIFRILQNISEIRESKLFPKFLSICQYILVLSVFSLSLMWPNNPNLHIVWFAHTIITTICTFLWDITIDFGFLKKGKNFPLKEKLFYKSKTFYYFVLLYDLPVRFIWLLTISPEVVYSYNRPEMIFLVINVLEIIRLGLWNCIKIEQKHLDICDGYKVSNDIELPFMKVRGKYVKNDTKESTVMNRAEKIKVEIDKIIQGCGEEKKNKKYLSSLSDFSERMALNSYNTNLNEFLKGYKDSCVVKTDSKKSINLHTLSRRI